jgi:hypothetical protein
MIFFIELPFLKHKHRPKPSFVLKRLQRRQREISGVDEPSGSNAVSLTFMHISLPDDLAADAR